MVVGVVVGVESRRLLVRSLRNADDEFDAVAAGVGVIVINGTWGFGVMLLLFVAAIEARLFRSGTRSPCAFIR